MIMTIVMTTVCEVKMITISKSKLKAQMLEIFREIEKTGEEVIVTDRDRPVLRIVPYVSKASVADLFAPYRAQAEIYTDLDTPTIDEWEDA